MQIVPWVSVALPTAFRSVREPVGSLKMATSILSPKRMATTPFMDAAAACEWLEQIYARNTAFLRERFEAYAQGKPLKSRVRATYPFVRITTTTHARVDLRLSYGFVSGPGVHETSITRPDLFRAYLTEQIGLLIQNHGVPIEVGELEEPIPIHFAYRRNISLAASFTSREQPLRDLFDTPNLAAMDDAIVDGTMRRNPGAPEPLALFRAAKIDYSLHRLYHYTGTDPEYFQNFVIFTNYQFYVDAFAHMCRERMACRRSRRAGLRRTGQLGDAQHPARQARSIRLRPPSPSTNAGISSG